jgi:hypothetical protein
MNHTPNLTYPYPHQRLLSDQELDRIAAQGWIDYIRENPKKEGDEWKE